MTGRETIRLDGGLPEPDDQPGGAGDLTAELIAANEWTEAMLTAAGIPIITVPFVTVGSGIGSSSRARRARSPRGRSIVAPS